MNRRAWQSGVSAIACLLVIAVGPRPASAGSQPTETEAVAALKSGHFAEAEAKLRALLAKDPANGRLRYYLGFCLIQQGQNVSAEEQLRLAVATNPKEHRWLEALSKALLDQGQAAPAMAALEKAIALAPLPEYRVKHALAASNAGRRDDAERELEAVLREEPHYALARCELGGLQLGSGRAGPARDNLKLCLGLVPGNIDATVALGKAEARLGNGEAAMKHYAEVLARSPDHKDALWGMGRALAQAGRKPESEPYFARFRAVTDRETRIKELLLRSHKNPRDAAARRELARLYLDAGNPAEARRWLGEAAAVAPESADSRKLRREIEAKLD